MQSVDLLGDSSSSDSSDGEMSDDFNLFDGAGGDMDYEDKEEAEFLDDLIERELG